MSLWDAVIWVKVYLKCLYDNKNFSNLSSAERTLSLQYYSMLGMNACQDIMHTTRNANLIVKELDLELEWNSVIDYKYDYDTHFFCSVTFFNYINPILHNCGRINTMMIFVKCKEIYHN